MIITPVEGWGETFQSKSPSALQSFVGLATIMRVRNLEMQIHNLYSTYLTLL